MTSSIHPTAPPSAPHGGQPETRSAPGLNEVQHVAGAIAANVERVLVGKSDVVRTAMVTLLAEGHLLVEDVPGVGKTSLAKALGKSIDCTVSRIQFTPDLLPSDITGVSIYNRQNSEFEFRPGPVFANIVVGDEINRASPKTQSALLECMAEHQVTVDGTTYPLGEPFMVVATQNPVEMEGTYALPEAQRDRFTARVSIGYPDPQAELAMVDEHSGHDPMADLRPVSTAAHVLELVKAVRGVHLAAEVKRYAVELVAASRRLPELRLGASPRATLHLVKAARAQAALLGRDFVVPDDVQAVAVPVLAHRLVLTAEAHASRRTAVELVRALLHRVPVPQGGAAPAPPAGPPGGWPTPGQPG
ncbi:MoxR-like ATPase [Actinoalloteichus hoggarensis]|uniref:ATPase family associated with various cellular activities (AAA) n=1 Tax=Actinoalloteichus hoggarensis TaxID=1470176 RepID=A0A221W149_9PSEU|nr:ATPase family associated with various cellular activities (AAA) [Actinoalloteichus hoggarensis]MBB5919857.1 MoxR-like ATPase [Actinoalloteichus hoggarensis]